MRCTYHFADIAKISPYKHLVVWLLAGTLAGCTAVPIPSLQQVLPAQWSQPRQGSPNGVTPDLHSWWKALGDAQLNALVDQALTHNLTVAQARSRLRQARLLAGRDNMQFRPTLSAGARTLQDVSAVDTYLQASLDSVWELGLFGARESIERAGQARLDGAGADIQAAQVSVVAEVVRSYSDLRAARYQQALFERIVELDVRRLALMDVRSRQHLGSLDDQRDVQMRLARARAELADSKRIADHALLGLAVLLGRTAPESAWNPPSTWPPQAPIGLGVFTLEQVPTDLLRYRPEIRNAEAHVLKSAAELGSATAELYPRITLGASSLHSRNLTQNRRITSSDVPAFGPLIDIPLFDWGRRRAAADAEKEALDASVLAYRQAVLEGVAEVESALSNLQRTSERSGYLRSLRNSLEKRVQQQAVLGQLGLSSALDKIGADRAALQADMELAAAEAAHTQAFIALYKSLGGAPLPVDENTSPAAGSAP